MITVNVFSQSLIFPKKLFGKQKSFVAQFYKHYPWLEYNVDLDAAFCSACHKTTITCDSTFSVSKSESAFTLTGFPNWKNAIEAFDTHERGECHHVCVARTSSLKSGVNVYAQLNKQADEERKQNLQCL